MIQTILQQSRKHDVVFSRRKGRIRICSRVSKDIGLKSGDVIDIAIKNGEYLLFVKYKSEDITGRYDGRVSPTNKGNCNNLIATSVKICNAMYKVVSNSEGLEALRLPAGNVVEVEGIGKAVPLITRTPL